MMLEKNPALGIVPAPPFRTAEVPLAVAVVAPAVPRPANVRHCQVVDVLAVLVTLVTDVADKVKVTVVGDACENEPTIVPLVYGEDRNSGESIESVFVTFALAGVAL
jgi:hypothetical protein